MTMAPNFSSILDRKPSEIEEPKAMPVGTYLVILQGQYQTGESSQKKTPFVFFPSKVLQAQDDVSVDEINTFGGVQGKELKGRQGLQFYTSEDAMYRLKEFLIDHLGIDPMGSDGTERSIKEMLADAPGKQVLVQITHQPSPDGKRLFGQVSATMKV